MISFIYPYFETPKMLNFQIKHWESFSKEVKEKIAFIIIDDGSPKFPAKINDCNLNLSLYRIKENIVWNHPGAQNLGATVCDTKWMWSGAMDNVISEFSVQNILDLNMTDYKTYYKFNDIDPLTKKITGIHYAVNFLSKELFWAIGGYDEDFIGFWGADDVCFEKMLIKFGGTRVVVPPEKVTMEIYSTLQIEDANTHTATKNLGWVKGMNKRNKKLWLNKMKEKIPYGENPLRFNWEEVEKFSI